ncbi:hypothetical protein TNCV_2968451 [Trichonephila clavipes]|nr:hypothetical protein TNCV_2968451 [Trichonephila clavipes]
MTQATTACVVWHRVGGCEMKHLYRRGHSTANTQCLQMQTTLLRGPYQIQLWENVDISLLLLFYQEKRNRVKTNKREEHLKTSTVASDGDDFALSHHHLILIIFAQKSIDSFRHQID